MFFGAGRLLKDLCIKMVGCFKKQWMRGVHGDLKCETVKGEGRVAEEKDVNRNQKTQSLAVKKWMRGVHGDLKCGEGRVAEEKDVNRNQKTQSLAVKKLSCSCNACDFRPILRCLV
nr:hypothetical protein [Tanacetum cinerariifolium]